MTCRDMEVICRSLAVVGVSQKAWWAHRVALGPKDERVFAYSACPIVGIHWMLAADEDLCEQLVFLNSAGLRFRLRCAAVLIGARPAFSRCVALVFCPRERCFFSLATSNAFIRRAFLKKKSPPSLRRVLVKVSHCCHVAFGTQCRCALVFIAFFCFLISDTVLSLWY